jgi:ABC-type sugar transport system ATPase subunit
MNGRPVRFANPKEAIEHGVGIIYQELDLVPEFVCVHGFKVAFLIFLQKGDDL